jgi:hypothetical protein
LVQVGIVEHDIGRLAAQLWATRFTVSAAALATAMPAGSSR